MSTAPIVLLTDGQVSAGIVLWRYRDRLQLSVVVKASFAITPDGVAAPAGPRELASDDRTFGGVPSRSVEMASDLAPYRPRCDVTFVGHAHAPGGRPAPSGSVRLGLARDGRPLIDKIVHVFGDRGAGGAPEPWTRMPLVYERAFGGPGEPNPLGSESPNILDPVDARRPAGFAPISRFWPARKRLLGNIDKRAIEAPIAVIPEEMPWDYYQSAPRDQQIEPLRGGEWLVLDGVHPSLPRVQTRLPATRGAARIRIRRPGAAPEDRPVEMVCDTLAIDGDRQTLSMVWRGRFEISGGEPALASHLVLAALEMPGAVADWGRIAASAADAPASAAAPASVPVEGAGEGTMAISSERADALAQRAATPFAAASPAPSAPVTTAATPWSGEVIRAAPSASTGEATLSGPNREAVGEGTFALRPEDRAAIAQRAIAPFAIQGPGTASAPVVSAGLPWTGPVTPAAPKGAVGEETMALGAAPRPIAPPPMMAIPADAGSAEPPIVAPPALIAAPPPLVEKPSIANASPPAPIVEKPSIANASPPAYAAPPVNAPSPKPPPKPAPAPLADRLRSAGASSKDIAALLRAMEPPPPPPPDEE
ncbi:Vegetative cell wall protein gp1 precursor (Hydroxyproline-rich glycoprotein 1) [Minicystis rosea]|nr:Vegetative cell wall protein gp1 precursor (Hydroxyproline-rich glycoprotein 1) [Minicystis rosea]